MKFKPFARKSSGLPSSAAASLDPLTRFRSGDARAFDEIVGTFAPGIVRLFRRHGVDPASADDLTQEVFVRLLRTSASYESRGRLQVYLYRIARNVWLDWRRAKKSRAQTRSLDLPMREFGVPVLALLAHPAVGPIDQLAGRDAARALTALLARLPDGERAVLELAVFEGMKYADVAAALGIPEGTVKSRAFHAIRKLRAWTVDVDAAEGTGFA